MPTSKNEMSPDTKALITVLCLIFAYPAGVILMWLWMKSWKTWVKVLLTLGFLPVLIVMLIIIAGIFAVANPSAQLEKGACVAKCAESGKNQQACFAECAIPTYELEE